MKTRKLTARSAIALLLALFAQVSPAVADWHQGAITALNFGYDGSTISFVLSGWTRSNCTCYSTWPNSMCLQRSRTSFKEEFAWLLAAKAREQVVNIYIDEASCAVNAIYE